MRIGINGFGRVGRVVVRAAFKKLKERPCPIAELPQIVAINDPNLTTEQVAYSLKYDSIHGAFQGEVVVEGETIKVDGQIIEVLHENDPQKICWKTSCAKYIVEASSAERAKHHLRDCVKRVIVSGPGEGFPSLVMGVNHDKYTVQMKIVSASTPAVNCAAPLLKVVYDEFGIEECLVNVIQSARSGQFVQDHASQVRKEGRSALLNIIPTFCDTSSELEKIFCVLRGHIASLTTMVPSSNGLMVDLTMKLKSSANFTSVCCKVKEASKKHMKDILACNEDKIVSSDVRCNPITSIFDGQTGFIQNKKYAKIIAWCDNEWSFGSRILDLIKYIDSMEVCNKK